MSGVISRIIKLPNKTQVRMPSMYIINRLLNLYLRLKLKLQLYGRDTTKGRMQDLRELMQSKYIILTTVIFATSCCYLL